MEYHVLLPQDCARNVWIFGKDDEKEGHVLFEPYRSICCLNCGRIPEETALNTWISPTIKIPSKRQIMLSNDGQLIFNRKIFNDAVKAGVIGLRYWELPGDPKYVVVGTEIVATTNVTESGVLFHDGDTRPRYIRSGIARWDAEHRCTVCDRAGETQGWPRARSFAAQSEYAAFMPSISIEKYARTTLMYLGAEATRFFRSNNLSEIVLSPVLD